MLVDIFAIDLCGYGVMSNHYHLVLRINQRKAVSWTDLEVAERWMMLFSGPMVVKYWARGETDAAESQQALEFIRQWRDRFYDLGWFMKCLNEHLARKANEEDCCKGRFWESRYKCQALLDEKALLSCLAYVDLNPVRAAMAQGPEDSDYTSVQQRVEGLGLKETGEKTSQPTLLPLVDTDSVEAEDEDTICRVRLMDYLELVDSTGRVVRGDKRGVISVQAVSILERIGIDERAWLAHMKTRRERQSVAMGSLSRLIEYARATGRRWVSAQRLASWCEG